MSNIQDMNNRMKQNRNLRPSKRSKFKENSRDPIYAGADQTRKANFKKFSEFQVKKVIDKIRKDAKSKQRTELVIVIFSLILLTAFFMYGLSNPVTPAPNPVIKIKEVESITWNGKFSNPLKIPGSNIYYVPVVREIQNEIKLNGSYTIDPPNMVGEFAENIVFFDKDCVEIGKLLNQNGSIYFMFSTQRYSNELLENGMAKILYLIAREDTNYDGDINKYDRHSLFISEVNGSGLKKITDRKIGSLQIADEGQIILMTFNDSYAREDSIYGCYDIMDAKLYISLDPNESD